MLIWEQKVKPIVVNAYGQKESFIKMIKKYLLNNPNLEHALPQ